MVIFQIHGLNWDVWEASKATFVLLEMLLVILWRISQLSINFCIHLLVSTVVKG